MLIHYFETSAWAGYALSTVLILASAEFGRFLGIRRRRRQPDARPRELTTLEGAAFGLLALMIGFTFAMTLSRFDARLRGVLDEANSIGTTALRARMLPEPHAGEVRKLLREYVQIRVDLMRAPHRPAALEQAIDRSNQLQQALWRHAVAVSDAEPRSVPIGLFVNSLNQMIDLQEARLAAMRNRVPAVVFWLLYGIAMVAVGLSGYAAGLGGETGRVPRAIVALMIAVVIAMVADIDRSQSGFVTVSQQATLDLATSLDR